LVDVTGGRVKEALLEGERARGCHVQVRVVGETVNMHMGHEGRGGRWLGGCGPAALALMRGQVGISWVR